MYSRLKMDSMAITCTIQTGGEKVGGLLKEEMWLFNLCVPCNTLSIAESFS